MLQSLFPHTENPLPLKSALCLSGAEEEFQPLIKTAAAAELKHLQSTPRKKYLLQRMYQNVNKNNFEDKVFIQLPVKRLDTPTHSRGFLYFYYFYIVE